MKPTLTKKRTTESAAGAAEAVDLSAEDHENLCTFDRMRDLLRDRTSGVAERYQNGCYVVGRPGSSKTYTISEQLRRLKVPSTYRNGRMSAAGLLICWKSTRRTRWYWTTSQAWCGTNQPCRSSWQHLAANQAPHERSHTRLRDPMAAVHSTCRRHHCRL